MSSPLISVAQLRAALAQDPAPALLDVRFDVLAGALRADYERAHIPGAAFVDLDADLAGEPGAGGRHPLPEPAVFIAAMRRSGVRRAQPVVVYDDAGGVMAARAWWLLRHYGQRSVTLLDGGLSAWVADAGELQAGSVAPEPGDFEGVPGSMPVLDADAAADLARRAVLLDVRQPERYRGEIEPLDPVAGHIPGARNRSTRDNLDAAGRFLDPGALREAFGRVGAVDGSDVGVYCGSGVTAAHAVLALEVAGIRAALYPGSWSGWVADPSRPVATGEG